MPGKHFGYGNTAKPRVMPTWSKAASLFSCVFPDAGVHKSHKPNAEFSCCALIHGAPQALGGGEGRSRPSAGAKWVRISYMIASCTRAGSRPRTNTDKYVKPAVLTAVNKGLPPGWAMPVDTLTSWQKTVQPSHQLQREPIAAPDSVLFLAIDVEMCAVGMR